MAAQCVALASTVLQFAVDRRLRPDNPAKGIKKPPVRKMQRFLSIAELGKLAAALANEATTGANLYPLAAIRLLALTGCRLGEVLGLQWSHVDFDRRVLVLPDSKTREKIVYLGPAARIILSELPRLKDNPYVIIGAKPGKPYVGISKVWERVRARAELPNVRIHDLRHSYASIGAGASLGLPIIGKLLGHTQAQTTARYSHLADDPLRRAADAIGATIAAAMEQPQSEVAK